MKTQTAQGESRLLTWPRWFLFLTLITAGTAAWIGNTYREATLAAPRTYQIYAPAHAIRATAPIVNQFIQSKGVGGAGGMGSPQVPMSLDDFQKQNFDFISYWFPEEWGGEISYYGSFRGGNQLYSATQLVENRSAHLGAIRRTFQIQGNTVVVTDEKQFPDAMIFPVVLLTTAWLISLGLLFVRIEVRLRP